MSSMARRTNLSQSSVQLPLLSLASSRVNSSLEMITLIMRYFPLDFSSRHCPKKSKSFSFEVIPVCVDIVQKGESSFSWRDMTKLEQVNSKNQLSYLKLTASKKTRIIFLSKYYFMTPNLCEKIAIFCSFVYQPEFPRKL